MAWMLAQIVPANDSSSLRKRQGLPSKPLARMKDRHPDAQPDERQRHRRPIPVAFPHVDPPMPEVPLDMDQVGSDRPTTIDAFREAFLARYGEEVSHLLRDQALQSFGSVQATAQRFLQAVAEDRPFRLAFAGYSITVGRGNFFHQSYPFVLYHLLEPLLQHSLQLPLRVTNAAIGGIPSFPYGFCLPHFLGASPAAEPDVVSWDYSMNEQGNTAVLEAYVRHSQQAYGHSRPLVLALDKHKGRCKLLQDYADQDLLRDALCVAKPSEIIPKATLELDEALQPPGLQKWTDFGAPDKCPGRGSWHPKKMEHATIAWTLASYFVDALEVAIELQQQGAIPAVAFSAPVVFPPPLSPSLPDNPPAVQNLLFGHATNPNLYELHKVSCRTNFLPAVDEDNLLTSLVVDGLVAEATAATILNERSDALYSQGWVLDVSKVERDTKKKVDKCGGLGYVDMKMALYGTAQSGPLHLWLPADDNNHEDHDHADAQASHWVDSVVICEANEKRPETACRLTHDLQYTVGGVIVASPVPVLRGAAEYLKRPTCVSVEVPQEAQMTQRNGSEWGLDLVVRAADSVTRDRGACCLSHVIWEHAAANDI
jgi:hypothetical protein